MIFLCQLYVLLPHDVLTRVNIKLKKSEASCVELLVPFAVCQTEVVLSAVKTVEILATAHENSLKITSSERRPESSLKG